MNGIHEVTGSIPVWSTTFISTLDRVHVAEGRRGYCAQQRGAPMTARSLWP